MATHHLLQEDWSDYDDRKRRAGSDAAHFACSEAWERDYLVKKILKTHPSVSETAARRAIESCCNSVPAPRARAAFVACVTKALGY